MVGFARGVVVGLMLVVGTVVVSEPASSEAFPGENGKIAFTSNRDGGNEIYVMGADGSVRSVSRTACRIRSRTGRRMAPRSPSPANEMAISRSTSWVRTVGVHAAHR